MQTLRNGSSSVKTTAVRGGHGQGEAALFRHIGQKASGRAAVGAMDHIGHRFVVALVFGEPGPSDRVE
jgi:hypothetical protein